MKFFECEINGNNVKHSRRLYQFEKPYFVSLPLHNFGGNLNNFFEMPFHFMKLSITLSGEKKTGKSD